MKKSLRGYIHLEKKNIIPSCVLSYHDKTLEACNGEGLWVCSRTALSNTQIKKGASGHISSFSLGFKETKGNWSQLLNESHWQRRQLGQKWGCVTSMYKAGLSSAWRQQQQQQHQQHTALCLKRCMFDQGHRSKLSHETKLCINGVAIASNGLQ